MKKSQKPWTYAEVTGHSFDTEDGIAYYYNLDGETLDEVPIDELMDTWLQHQNKRAMTLKQPKRES